MAKSVTINGKTYNGIISVGLPLSDGTGTALFDEHQEGETEAPLFPLQAGTMTGTNAIISVSSGHTVSCDFIGNGVANQLLTTSLWSPFATASGQGTRSHSVGFKLFTIPSGATVTMSMDNLSPSNAAGVAFGITIAGSSTGLGGGAIGVNGGNIQNVSQSVTFTTTQAYDISAAYVVYMGGNTGDSFSFDINLTVNGVRWI